MLNWLIFLILIGEVIIFTFIDRCVYKTWITPFTLLAVPYTTVSIIAFCFSQPLGFIPLYVESVLIWVISLLVFWLGGLVIMVTLGKSFQGQIGSNYEILYEKKSLKISKVIAFFVIPVISYHALKSVNSVGGLNGIGTEDFATIYGGGLGGHLLVFSMILFVFLIGSFQHNNSALLKLHPSHNVLNSKQTRVCNCITNKKMIFSILVSIFLLIILRQVKYLIILPFIAALIYRFASRREKFSGGLFTFSLTLIFIFFAVSYFISFYSRMGNDTFSYGVLIFIIRHFVSYIIGGVLVMGEMYHQGIHNINIDPLKIFSPFIAIYELISSSKITHTAITGDYNLTISLDGNKKSNVYTLFGLVFFALGPIGATIYTLFLGFFSYLMFAISFLTRNCWLVVMWSFIGAMLVLSWFGSYFTLLMSIEVPVYCIILACLVWLFGKSNFLAR